MAYNLRCHPGDDWPINCHLKRAVEIQNTSDPIHRDELYAAEVSSIMKHTTIRSHKLVTRTEAYHKAGEKLVLKETNVYPSMWYAWKCARADKLSFKVRLQYHPSDPRDQLRLAVLSRPTIPDLNVSRWRKQDS